MKIVNPTPFQLAPFVGRMSFPGHSLTLIVKATFDLSPGGRAEPAEEQRFPTGDEPHPDDEEGKGSVRYASDFVPFKPRADLLLAGTCRAPGGRPAESVDVSFGVGDCSRTLRVFGDRRWTGPLGLRSMSAPAPFAEQPLQYERSYGGAGFDSNPVGVGHSRGDGDGKDDEWLLPNIEDPRRLIRSPRSHPAPAGFGPLGATWKDRAGLLGTYKKKWLKERWPWYPEDFDFLHFNAAPPEMQCEGYVRGDETLSFENLHPEHPRYQAELPGLRVRCFVNARNDSVAGEPIFREVSMNLDTLYVDADDEQLVLVWRGWTDVLSEDYEEVDHIFVAAESLDEVSATPEECRALFYELLEEEADEGAAAEEPPVVEEAAAGEDVGEEADAADAATAAAAMRASIEAKVSETLAAAGISLAALSPADRELAEGQKAEAIDGVIGQGADPDAQVALHRSELDEQLGETLGQLGLDPANLPPVSEAALAEHAKLLEVLGASDPMALATDPSVAPILQAMSAVLPMAGLDPENLAPLIDEAKKQGPLLEPEPEPEAQAQADTDGRVRPPTRESVEAEHALGESFAGETLAGLDLSGLALAGADFGGADLSGTNLAGADLSSTILTATTLVGSDLSQAKLDAAQLGGADLSNATLVGASLQAADATRATLVGANLQGSTLTEAIFEGANLSGALLEGAEGTDAWFVAAQLGGSRFARSRLPEADFSQATLDGADFAGAMLAKASIEGASCTGANFEGADLTELRASDGTDFSGSRFIGVQAPESIWEDAILTGADFSHAILHGALFLKAGLQQANLTAADMKGARFMKANLSESVVTDANLFEGSLERANLADADFSGANLYAVEFLDAELEGARFDGANLRMSKLG